jgi:hypothetical protein
MAKPRTRILEGVRREAVLEMVKITIEFPNVATMAIAALIITKESKKLK